ncbi:MAG: MlaD family protein, partial [Desulfovibrionaceae bacterium]|nr:MlaD family protein [Desulfovibrionaceae bacterium]
GLRVGADIEVAGVPVGKVSAIDLKRTDQETSAIVTLHFNQDMTLSDDTIASVRTSGLIGDKFIDLAPGGSPDLLKAGDTITDTEPAVDIGMLISKYAFGSVK